MRTRRATIIRRRIVAGAVVLAAAVGVGLTKALTRSPAQTPAASSSTTPGAGQSGGGVPGQSGGAVPGGAGGSGGNEVSEISMLAPVHPGEIIKKDILPSVGLSVTAAVTSATKITGRVGSIGQIKVGDQVSAQMTQSGSKITAVAIQYPAAEQQPVGPP